MKSFPRVLWYLPPHPPFILFPIGIGQGSGTQDLLPNDICSLRQAEGPTVSSCEVRPNDKTPYQIPSREAAYALPWAHEGLSNPEPAGLLCSSAAKLKSFWTMSYARLGMCGGGPFPHCRPEQT